MEEASPRPVRCSSRSPSILGLRCPNSASDPRSGARVNGVGPTARKFATCRLRPSGLETRHEFPRLDGVTIASPDDRAMSELERLRPAANATIATPEHRPAFSRALATTALLDALSAEHRLALAGEGASLLLVGVPTASWLEPMEEAIAAEIGPVDKVFIAKQASRNRCREPSSSEVSAKLERGEKVVLLAVDLDAHVDTNVRIAADLEVTITPSTARVVRRAVRRATGSRPRTLSDEDLVGLDFLDLFAAVRRGSSNSLILHRIRRTRLRKMGQIDSSDVPTLDEISGLGEVGNWARTVVSQLERTRQRATQLPVPSMLLVGPPGVGKTMISRALARSARVGLAETSVGAWFSEGDGALGDVIRAIDTVVERVLDLPVGVLFLDELDAVPDRKRLSQRGRDWWTPVITHLLTQIDRIRRTRPGVLVLGATNLSDRLDEALVRPGRFDGRLDVKPPDEAALREILGSLVGDSLSPADVAVVAKLGVGAMGAVARNWTDAARSRAAAEGRTLVLSDLLEEVAPPDTRSEAERRTVALHEFGHAVVAFDLGETVLRLSLLPGSGRSGETHVVPPRRHSLVRDHDDAMVIAPAGRAADEILGLDPNIGATEDLARATAIAMGARTAAGLRGHLTHRGDPEAIPALLARDPASAKEIEEDLRKALDRAREIVRRRRRDVLAVAERLLERRQHDGNDLAMLLPTNGARHRSTDLRPG